VRRLGVVAFRARFLYRFAVRLAAESVSAHIRRRARRADPETTVDGLMMTLWAMSSVALAALGSTVVWWILTGRGAGGKIIAVEQDWLPHDPEALARLWK
jgi:hypothetical protein